MVLTEIHIDKSEGLDLFYQIGADIRSRHNEFELPWTETRDIEAFIEQNEVNTKLLVVDQGDYQGRVMAFQFADSTEKGYLGWYECDPSDEIANLLIKECERWLKSKGVITIYGPMNGSSWGTFRFNTISSKPLFATEPYQPLYYIEHWLKAGFHHDVMYETHLVPKEISRPMRLLKVKAFAALKGVHFKRWPKGLINDEQGLRDMYNFFHECFQENPLYRPISFEKYKEITIKLEKIIDFKHSLLFTDKDGKPASVLISYKDVYNKLYKEEKLSDPVHNTHTLYMKTIATAKAWRGKHLSRVLVNFGFVEALRNGYKEVVFGTMMAQNNSAKFSRTFYHAKPLREYTFMKKDI